MDLIVRNGTLVSPSGRLLADLAADEGRIVDIALPGQLSASKATEEIDAAGQFVLPGVIDGHVHFREPGLTHKEDWASGSLAAVMGGVTTVLDMPNTLPPTSTAEHVRAKQEIAESKAYCDFGLLGLVVQENVDDLRPMAEAGVTGYKCFLGESIGNIPAPDDGVLLDSMREVAAAGLRIGFHAENNAIMQHRIRQLKATGRTDAVAHVESRPTIAEVEAIQRVALFARHLGTKIHIFHLSSKDGLEMIDLWRGLGVDVTCETGAHYCFLSSDDMRELGAMLRMNPPVRETGHGEPLLRGLVEGRVNAIATDHSPHTLEEKTRQDIWQAVSGFAGVETSVRLFLTYAVNAGAMTLEEYVRAASEGPAKAWGLFPRKGSLQVGADADLTVVDLERTGVIEAARMHGKNNHNPFEGHATRGEAVATVVRGQVVMREGELVGKPQGRMVTPWALNVPGWYTPPSGHCGDMLDSVAASAHTLSPGPVYTAAQRIYPKGVAPWPKASPSGAEPSWDVIVVGGGNAALVSAISARDAGAQRVLVLERAPTWIRGGNSRHTRNTRCAHGAETAALAYNTGVYSEDELMEDLLQVGGGPSANPEVAQMVVRESTSVVPWMTNHGVRWQRPLKGTLHLNRTNSFFLGGGKALVNTYYQAAEDKGIEVWYEAAVADLLVDGSRIDGVVVVHDETGERRQPRAKAVVIASGGFEANLTWLGEYWGEAAANYVVRGTPYNDGRVLRLLLDAGAVPVGDPRGFHAVAVDARAPRYDGGIATRLDSVPFGIVVNKHGQRFSDEGANLWPKRYASWGGLIAVQPDQIAYSLFDSRMLGQFITSLYRPFESATIPDLAVQLGLDAMVVRDTVERFNRSIRPGGSFNPAILDDCSTDGLDPPKSHWAVAIEQPPFYGYPLRPGITFTYRGVGVDTSGRVQMNSGGMRNLYAAGEIMSGNVLREGYLAGFGLTIGTVSGRIAGREAASHAAH